MNALTFKEHEIIPFDNKDGKIWFTGEQLAKLLGYADIKQVNKIYQRHKDEFTDTMTTVVKVTASEKSMSYGELSSDLRLFSSRGAHLIGMMSRTKVAKELRKWLLDIIEKESGVSIVPLRLEDLMKLTGQQVHDCIALFDKASFKHRGQKGSGLMTQRKRDIKRIKEATKLALQITQFTLPGFDDFPDGEPA
ncbi:BRO-N domain-containing protein [Photorhabdus bodei]|uniref:BRO-N domain-containing protein n=1 Tax=Photorhabdus bodei TaxID=2029681 RepID=UPI001E2D79BC|nr:BRO family protein [Photorhabdus bodei]MCC8466993.1 hypothetical protein [Photorhabdus bodei]